MVVQDVQKRRMIEEDFQMIEIDRRLTSKERQDESGDSDDEFFIIDQDDGSTSFLIRPSSNTDSSHTGSQQPQGGSSDVQMRLVSSSRDRLEPESYGLESEIRPIKLLLSTCGHPFPDRASASQDTDTGLYGLLTAESPHYLKKAESISNKFEKASGCTKIKATKWARPDLKLLYWFRSGIEYQTMAQHFREGKMRNILTDKEKYRAVALEPVRIIDSELKGFISMEFPATVNTDIKHTLKLLFDPVLVSRRSIFIPSNSHHELTPVEDTDSNRIPSVVISLITNMRDTSTARRISDVLRDSNSWTKYSIPFQSSSANVFQYADVFHHNKHHHYLPLVSFTSGQAGWSMSNGIRIILFCGAVYKEMVEFYSLILGTKSAQSKDHVIFVLTKGVLSLLELVLCNETSLTVNPLDTVHLHFIVQNLTKLVGELSRRFVSTNLDGIGKGVWHLCDPFGNRVDIHDCDALEKLE